MTFNNSFSNSNHAEQRIDNYVVIGNPIAHSQSPFIHQQFAQQTGQTIEYEHLLAPIDQFAQTVKQFQVDGGKGANVTLPFKLQAFALADQCSAAAQQAQAANTLIFRNDSSIYADNTDGVGLINDLKRNLNISLGNKKILILGAGGATRGILSSLLAEQPAQLIIANRTASKANELAQHFAGLGSIDSCDLNEIPAGPYDIIINATSIGLSANEFNLAAEKLVAAHSCCYDLAYRVQPTAFMQWAKQQGAHQCHDGLGMLVEQAAAAFFLWRGVYPQTTQVIKALVKRLREK